MCKYTDKSATQAFNLRLWSWRNQHTMIKHLQHIIYSLRLWSWRSQHTQNICNTNIQFEVVELEEATHKTKHFQHKNWICGCGAGCTNTKPDKHSSWGCGVGGVNIQTTICNTSIHFEFVELEEPTHKTKDLWGCGGWRCQHTKTICNTEFNLRLWSWRWPTPTFKLRLWSWRCKHTEKENICSTSIQLGCGAGGANTANKH